MATITTCTPSTESTAAYLSDVKTFFEDKWNWTNINVVDTTADDYSGDTTLPNSVEFYVDDRMYFLIAEAAIYVGCITSTGKHNIITGMLSLSNHLTSFMVYQTNSGLWITASDGSSTGYCAVFKMNKLSDNSEITGFSYINSGLVLHQGSYSSSDSLSPITASFSRGMSSQGGSIFIPPTDSNISINSTDTNFYPATSTNGMFVYLAQSDVFPSDGSVVKFQMDGINYIGNNVFVLVDN